MEARSSEWTTQVLICAFPYRSADGTVHISDSLVESKSHWFIWCVWKSAKLKRRDQPLDFDSLSLSNSSPILLAGCCQALYHLMNAGNSPRSEDVRIFSPLSEIPFQIAKSGSHFPSAEHFELPPVMVTLSSSAAGRAPSKERRIG